MTFEARGKHVRLPAEVREDGDDLVVEGYAAVFNEEADIGGFFREKIAPGAFSNVIDRDDTVFLINHEGLPLARTGSGTLELRQDQRGLKIRARIDPADPDVARITGKMRRGDLDKMSFAFWIGRQEWDETGDVPLRTILEVERLHDVSIVTVPAYDGTEIALRSLDAARVARRQTNFHAARRRLRMRGHLELKVRENG